MPSNLFSKTWGPIVCKYTVEGYRIAGTDTQLVELKRYEVTLYFKNREFTTVNIADKLFIGHGGDNYFVEDELRNLEYQLNCGNFVEDSNKMFWKTEDLFKYNVKELGSDELILKKVYLTKSRFFGCDLEEVVYIHEK